MRQRSVARWLSGTWGVVALSYLITWLFWVPLALSDWSPRQGGAMMALYLLGGFGPSAAGIIAVGLTEDRAARRLFWQRVFSFRRIPGPLYLTLLVYPLCLLGGLVVAPLLGGDGPTFEVLRAGPAAVVSGLVINLMGGPVSEELGWRGVVWDRMRARRPFLPSALVLGLIWALWHLPLFWVNGTTQNTLYAFPGLGFWAFILQGVLFTVLFGWVYDRTDRSILSAILLHWSVNAAANTLYPFGPVAIAATSVLLAIVVAVIVAPERRHT